MILEDPIWYVIPGAFISLFVYSARLNAYFEYLGRSRSLKKGIRTREAFKYFLIK